VPVTKMTGGRALVEMLTRHGVDTLFALPGVQNDALFVALYDAAEAIRVIHPRHEQAAAYMAFGYARASGRPGAFAVVPGPGLLNTTAALSTAYATNAPVLCISGQIPSDLIGRGFGLLHEIPDQLAILKGLTKWAARIGHPTETGKLVNEAFRQLVDGRPRPVALEMPLDVMALAGEVDLPPVGAPPAPPTPDPELIDKAADLLAAARQPLIYVGSGAMAAGAEILALAERLQAPVVASTGGKGVVSDRHYLAQNMLGGHELWKTADVALAIGTRFNQPLTRWGLDANIKDHPHRPRPGRDQPRVEAGDRAGRRRQGGRRRAGAGARRPRRQGRTATRRAREAEGKNLGASARAARPAMRVSRRDPRRTSR
jgi:acetolactate synthase I/II/III large subunit